MGTLQLALFKGVMRSQNDTGKEGARPSFACVYVYGVPPYFLIFLPVSYRTREGILGQNMAMV